MYIFGGNSAPAVEPPDCIPPMLSVDEAIVREYFEGQGFLVRRLRNPLAHAPGKPSGQGLDLLVFNPRFTAGGRQPGFLLFSSELPYIDRAVVLLQAGNAGRFSPGLLKSRTKLARFLEQAVGKRGGRRLPEGEEMEAMENAFKILVLPGLPTAEPFRSEAVDLLRSRGIDGIISFRSMLLEVIARVDTNHSYQNSDLLETIRLLKTYELIKGSQMELFRGLEDNIQSSRD